MIGIIVNQSQTIFISHSSADNDAALSIHEQLHQRGFRPWLAVTDVPPGANYARTIMEALESASAFVLLLTEAALKSEHVAREVEVAVSQKIPIFPLNMSGKRDVQPLLTKEWRYWLAIVQVLNATDTAVAVDSLIGAINRQGLEIGDSASPLTKNPQAQNKLQIPAALQANKSRNEQAERLKREQDAKAVQDRLSQEARERDRIAQEKVKKELEEQERKRKEELDAKLAAEKKERERIEQEERERKQKEELVHAAQQKRLESAQPRLDQASRVVDWLDKLTDWLYFVAGNGPSSEENFDYDSFKSTFDKNFNVELDGIEDLASEEIFGLGLHTLDIYRILVANPYLTNGDAELAKPFLDLSLQYKWPWAFFDLGEWEFARNGVEAGKRHFLTPKNQEIILEKAKKYAEDVSEGSEERKALAFKSLVFEWKWMELLVQLADKKIRPDKLNSIFQEIDKTLTKDSANELAEVYLSPILRIQWKLLGSFALFRLERNTAARNFLRGFDQASEDYRTARGRIHYLHGLATKEVADFFADFLKVIDSWW
jgi:hypothetical protein